MLASKKKKKIIELKQRKPHCNIGTIGHADHGKTTLTASITKLLNGIGSTVFKPYSSIDNCVEERTRGITINAAHIEYETVKRHYSHIDCPGHRQYIKNMLTGATQMEGAILVVAANKGPDYQTKEHVILAREVGIPCIVGYLNKIDLKPSVDYQDIVDFEIRELLDSYSYSIDSPIVRGSAKRALEENEPSDLGLNSVKKLMDIVDDYIPQPQRQLDAPFLMPIESSLTVTGRGTVVTGKVELGTLKINDNLELLGKNIIKTSCMGIEMYYKTLTFAEVGDNIGVLLKGIKQKNVSRGDLLCAPNTVFLHKSFIAKVYILTTKGGFGFA